MNIIQLLPNENESRPPIQTWDLEQPPEGYAEVLCPIDVFVSSMGFVDLELADGQVVAMTPNSEALEAYLASRPEDPDTPSDPAQPVTADVLAAAYLAGVQDA